MAFGMMMQAVTDNAYSPDPEDDDEEREKKKQARASLESVHWMTDKNNVVVPLGIPYKSSADGLWEFPYIKVKLDQFARIPYSMGRNIKRAMNGEPVHMREFMGAIADNLPITALFNAPPTLQAFFALTQNVDLSSWEKIYKKAPVPPYLETQPKSAEFFKVIGDIGGAVEGIPGVGKITKGESVGGMFSPARTEVAMGKMFTRNPLYEGFLWGVDIVGNGASRSKRNKEIFESITDTRVLSSLFGAARSPYVDEKKLIKDAIMYGVDIKMPIGNNKTRNKTTQELVDEVTEKQMIINGDALKYENQFMKIMKDEVIVDGESFKKSKRAQEFVKFITDRSAKGLENPWVVKRVARMIVDNVKHQEIRSTLHDDRAKVWEQYGKSMDMFDKIEARKSLEKEDIEDAMKAAGL
jgi:hypothetical protein